MTIDSMPAKARLISIVIGTAAFLAFGISAGAAKAEATFLDNAKPSIWVSPDGCEYYAVYNGLQGFMTPRFEKNGSVVCTHPTPCLVASNDQFFATGSARINAEGRRRLVNFFRTNGSASYVIDGNTDNVGGYRYNIRLSQGRAEAVAAIARSMGADVTNVQGFGYTRPVASNATAAGRARNRRVDVMCSN
jgi:outer membrane protein OmpA-like peptidoglycan-associated protein